VGSFGWFGKNSGWFRLVSQKEWVVSAGFVKRVGGFVKRVGSFGCFRKKSAWFFLGGFVKRVRGFGCFRKKSG